MEKRRNSKIKIRKNLEKENQDNIEPKKITNEANHQHQNQK